MGTFRYSLRVLRASPGFTLIAMLTLALGMAANTTVFSWVDGLLWRPFPGSSESRQLAVMEMITAGAPTGGNQVSYLDYRDYRQQLRSLAGLAVDREEVFSLGSADNTQPVWGELVSGNFFDVLGMRPALGRVFTREEDGDQLGAHAVAVISYRLWRSRFRGDPGAVGRALRVNRRELTIVGVAPAEFRGAMPGLAFDIWVPVTMGPALGMLDVSAFRNRGYHCLYAVARLKAGVTIEQASAEALTFSRSLQTAFPGTNRRLTAAILPPWQLHSGAPELLLGPLRILMAVSLLVLMIVCANVANLLLERSVARRRELTIRLALGAGRWRVVRQLFLEVLLLAGAGALIGLPLARWAGEWLPSLVPHVGVSVSAGFHWNARVLAFTVLTCVLAALAAAAAPALLWLRADVHESLKEGGRGGMQGARSHRTRGLLVVSEMALAAVALAGAGLFLRSFRNAEAIYPGFDRSRVALARFYLSGAGFNTLETRQFCQRLARRLAAAPGVAAASYADQAPLGSSAGPWAGMRIEGYVPAYGEAVDVSRYLVAPGYFDLLRIPLLEGRDFRDSDDGNAPPVIMVNQAFARRYFRGASPIGRRVRCWNQWATIVGMVRDSKYFNVAETPRPHFFAPFRQRAGSDTQLFFYVKAAGDPAAVMAGLRREVAGVDPNAAAFDTMRLSDWTGITMFPQKVAASMLMAMGLIALVLAAVGLYSVMAYAVSQRTQEIGIRMALGAQRGDVLRDVLRRGMRLAAAGLLVGLAGAFGAARLVSSMLVGVSAADPAAFAGAAVFLAGVALLASYVPARRATRVDPAVALRAE